MPTHTAAEKKRLALRSLDKKARSLSINALPGVVGAYDGGREAIDFSVLNPPAPDQTVTTGRLPESSMAVDRMQVTDPLAAAHQSALPRARPDGIYESISPGGNVMFSDTAAGALPSAPAPIATARAETGAFGRTADTQAQIDANIASMTRAGNIMKSTRGKPGGLVTNDWGERNARRNVMVEWRSMRPRRGSPKEKAAHNKLLPILMAAAGLGGSPQNPAQQPVQAGQLPPAEAIRPPQRERVEPQIGRFKGIEGMEAGEGIIFDSATGRMVPLSPVSNMSESQITEGIKQGAVTREAARKRLLEVGGFTE